MNKHIKMRGRFLGFVLLPLISFAQQIPEVKVSYIENNGAILNKNVVLIANNTTGIYIENLAKKNYDATIAQTEKNSSFMTVTNPKAMNQDRIYLLSRNSDSIKLSNAIKGKKYEVLDVIPTLQWKLIPHESKKIGSFVCEKATVTFRGSHLTAYYTKQIPISFGPYKFKGLPGLILAIYQEESFNNISGPDYHNSWVATSVEYPYQDSASYISNLSHMAFKDAESISYKDFLALTEAESMEFIKRIQSTAPAGTKTVDMGKSKVTVEQKYEWEK